MHKHVHMHWTGAAADRRHRCGTCHRRGRLQGHLRGCCVERAPRGSHGSGGATARRRAADGADGARRRAGDRDHRRARMVRAAVLAAAELATNGSRRPRLWLPSRSSCVCVMVDQKAALGLARARARLARGRGEGRSWPRRHWTRWSHCVRPPRLARPRCRRYARNPAAGGLWPSRPDCARGEACGSRGGGAGYRGHGQGLAARHYHGDALPLSSWVLYGFLVDAFLNALFLMGVAGGYLNSHASTRRSQIDLMLSFV